MVVAGSAYESRQKFKCENQPHESQPKFVFIFWAEKMSKRRKSAAKYKKSAEGKIDEIHSIESLNYQMFSVQDIFILY